MRAFMLGLLAAIAFGVTSVAALADDWTVTRLRGTVQQLVGGEWQPLERGSVVPDERSIFTRSNGYATLVRGNEAIELGPNTKIEIYDQGGRKPFTTILQHAGTLTVEAEVRNVQHFAVKTAYLAAVVKGTRFTVTAKSSGGSVEVFRGQVSVEDKRNAGTVLILAGQKVSVAKSGAMKVTGKPKAGAKPTGKATSNGAKNAMGASNSNGAANGKDSTGKGVDETDKTTEDNATKDEDNSSNIGRDVVETVSNVVDTTTNTVTQVVDTTTNTVVDVVDKTTDTVDKVVDTATDTADKVTGTTDVGTIVDTVTDNTTKGLTGLLGKKPR